MEVLRQMIIHSRPCCGNCCHANLSSPVQQPGKAGATIEVLADTYISSCSAHWHHFPCQIRHLDACGAEKDVKG